MQQVLSLYLGFVDSEEPTIFEKIHFKIMNLTQILQKKNIKLSFFKTYVSDQINRLFGSSLSD
jgi:hypothetical protein